ncbi:hypothetical protein A2U01_0116101, partial [Trifolium medium]|nr:hypothetical protein [Trifolium medium]
MAARHNIVENEKKCKSGHRSHVLTLGSQ